MRPIPAPAIAVSDVLTDCISGAELNLQPRLEAIRSDLNHREAIYRAAATGTALHTLSRGLTLGAVTSQELKQLYPDHMSNPRGSARSHYNAIKNRAPNKRCTLCGAGTVVHLDHHLPKSRYPDLAIIPINLVPVCNYCNSAKSSRFPTVVGEQTLHPYFDDQLKGQWLIARVDQGPPVTVVYDTATPTGWSSVDAQRARRHFTILKMGDNFSSCAGDELGPLREHLVLIWKHNDPTPIRDHLAEQVNRYRIRINSWQHAFYQALLNNTWFINGGFLQIEHQKCKIVDQ